MVSETDIAYLAGLFDGEGNIQYKQYMRQRRNNEKSYKPTNGYGQQTNSQHSYSIARCHSALIHSL